MRRTNSVTFDSTGKIASNLQKTVDIDRNKLLLSNIRHRTLTNAKKIKKYEEPTQEVAQQVGIFTKYTKSLKKSLVFSRRKECEICELVILANDQVSISDCPHLFCTPCATSYVTYKINAFEDVLCPKQGCGKPINQNSELFHGLAIELKKKFQKHEKFNLTQKDPTKKPCQKPDCQGIVEIVDNTAICNECHTVYCHLCLYEKHEGECSDFQVEFLQNNYKFRQCSQCKNVIEKNEGCNHITCRCGHQFCYICGADWDKDPCRNTGPPPPPPQPRSTCACIGVWTLKILLIPIWAIAGIAICLLPFLAYTTVILLSSVFGGPCEYVSKCFHCRNFWEVLAIILLPVSYVLSIPVYFISKFGDLGESLVACAGLYCDVMRNLVEW